MRGFGKKKSAEDVVINMENVGIGLITKASGQTAVGYFCHTIYIRLETWKLVQDSA